MIRRRDVLRGVSGSVAIATGSSFGSIDVRGRQQSAGGTWRTFGGGETNTSHNPALPTPAQKPEQLTGWDTASGNNVLFPGSIVVGDSHVYGVSDQLYAFDPDTGEEVWRFDTRGRTKATPAVEDGTIYVAVPANGNVFAVDTETGQRQWNRVVEGLENETSVTVVDGTVFALGRITYGCYPCRQKATVTALDASEGTVKWSTTVNDMDHNIPQRAPAVADGKVYITVSGGGLYVLDVETGEKRRHFSIGGQTLAPPVIANEKIIVTGGPRVRALDLESYEEEWRFKTTGKIAAPPAVADGTTYVPSGDGNLYALDLETGQRDWNVPVPSDEYGLRYQKPCVLGNTVLVGNRKIHAFNTTDGTEAWATSALVDESSLQLSRVVPGEDRIYWSQGILTTDPATPTSTQTPVSTATAGGATEEPASESAESSSESSAPGFGASISALSVAAVAGYLGIRERNRGE